MKMNERLARLPIAEWDALVVFAECNDLMMFHRLYMHRNALGAVTDFNIVAMVADPNLSARIQPRHRIATAPP